MAAPKAENGRIELVQCDICNHRWVAVFQFDTEDGTLECPKCHKHSSTVKTMEVPDFPA